MSDLRIGKVGGKVFRLPADVQVQTIAVLGIRGSGKTVTATVIVEELLRIGGQVVIIDPTDVWWGLKSSGDGKRDGFPVVVMGGDHGDLPITGDEGATLADFLVDNPVPAILSLRHLRKNKQRAFVTAFAEQLYHRKGETKRRTPLQVVIDECDAFVPQKVGSAEARMVGAIEDLVRRGRASGIGVTLISQRAASVNKDVLTQLELLVAHRHTSPHDRKALDEWVKAHDTQDRRDTFMADVAGLPRGEAWFWSPGWLDVFERVAVDMRSTFDSSATPKAGTKIKAPKKLADVDIEALKSQLATTIEAAEANDPKKLKAIVSKLEAELEKARKAKDEDAARIKAERDAAWTEAFREKQKPCDELRAALSELGDDGRRIIARIESVLPLLTSDAFDCHVDELIRSTLFTRTSVSTESSNRRISVNSYEATRPDAVKKRGRFITDSIPSESAETRIPRCECAILTVLAQSPDGRTHVQTAIIAGYSHKSGGFKNAMSSLRTKGWIEGRGARIRITQAGLEARGPVQRLPQGKALVGHWCSQLGKCERTILHVLADQEGGHLTHEGLAAATDYSPTSGGFKNALSKLRTLELITRGAEIRLSHVFYE